MSCASSKPIKTPKKLPLVPAEQSDKMICAPQEFLIPNQV